MAEPSDVADRTVLGTLKREKVPLKASEIAQWSGLTYDTVRRACYRLEGKGQVYFNGAGYWALTERT